MAATLARHRQWILYAASIVYRTLGATLQSGAAAAAPILPLAMQYANQHYAAVKRAGHRGNRLTLGSALFQAILDGRSGVVLSHHAFADTWSRYDGLDRTVACVVPAAGADAAAMNRSSVAPRRSGAEDDYDAMET